MIKRPLMTPDELKSIPKGSFIVSKTGSHPMRTRLKLFTEWGINFEEAYAVPERAARKVCYADRKQLITVISAKYGIKAKEDKLAEKPPRMPESSSTASVYSRKRADHGLGLRT